MIKKLTYEQLDSRLSKIANELKDKGLPVPVDKIDAHIKLINSTTVLGRCNRIYRFGSPLYIIQLSRHALDDDQTINNVIAHEIVHTLDGCFNHGKEFKRYARIVTDIGYHVDTKASAEESAASGIIKAKSSVAKYKIICTQCGHVYYRQKACKLTKYPLLFNCGACKGELKVEKIY